MENYNLFILEHLDKILFIGGAISILLLILFFWLLFKIKSLLEDIVINTSPKYAADWTCPECNTVNKGNSFTCVKCNYSLR